MQNHNANPVALLPLVLFLALFLGVGFYFQSQGVDFAFYQLPAPAAMLPAVLLAVFLSRLSLDKTIAEFVQGAGHSNIITMCLIYLMAGAFSSVAKASGGVDATVALGLQLVPASFILPGLFIIAAFIATSMGTSMGTLAALAPIASGVALQAGIEPALMAGVLVSGAIFGDNLSIISDTTIAATRTQGCDMKDKFRANIKLALPAALLVIVLLLTLGVPAEVTPPDSSNLWLVLPYVLILILAVAGMNVFTVLTIGIVASALLGMLFGEYQVVSIGKDVYNGFTQMQEVFILSLLLGGLSALMRQQGGLVFLVNAISRLVKATALPKELGYSIGIAGLISSVNACVANNTVAIIVAGDTVKSLAKEGGIEAKQAASLVDIFACVLQGILPYGAQLLLLGASFSISPVDIIPFAFYCYLLAIITILSFVWHYIRHKKGA
ncbi:Na+/H+ antiporter NhaC family protein [Neptunicella marina]|uniref:Na+/H+ antiporter NhaC family protein n=1 Tax=Neptunicella marina TaxID=2125989 RepID=A0A8J6M2S6_9ALTE|nr:Na+/H+ antiporter NhaC family protein [Neptunicella marina]MBC3766447.1 Na+/H+ antiporter NhaC family protein [Neptunicella marina]